MIWWQILFETYSENKRLILKVGHAIPREQQAKVSTSVNRRSLNQNDIPNIALDLDEEFMSNPF